MGDSSPAIRLPNGCEPETVADRGFSSCESRRNVFSKQVEKSFFQ